MNISHQYRLKTGEDKARSYLILHLYVAVQRGSVVAAIGICMPRLPFVCVCMCYVLLIFLCCFLSYCCYSQY